MAYRRGRVQQDGDRRRGSCVPQAPRAFLPTTAPALPELAPPKSVLAHAARGWVEPPTRDGLRLALRAATARRPSACAPRRNSETSFGLRSAPQQRDVLRLALRAATARRPSACAPRRNSETSFGLRSAPQQRDVLRLALRAATARRPSA